MKRFLLPFALFAVFAAFASPVSTNEAATAVANWLASGQAMGCAGMGSVAGVEAYDAKGGKGRFYVISLRNDEGAAAGYVVTSTARSLNTVLAYSESGTFEATDKNPLWTMLGIDVPSATRAMEAAAAQPGGSRLASVAPGGSSAANGQDARFTSANERKWAHLLSGARLQGTSLSSISDVRVNTLLETRWGQEDRGENYYTPKGYVCGCVATAMAQIMRYWRYPTQSITLNYPYNDDGAYVGPGNGTRSYEGEIDGEAGRWNAVDGYKKTSSSGYTAWSPAFGGTYDWNNMPAAGASYSLFGLNATEAAAIGKLTRDCGISVHMDFSDDGSGSANYLVPKRLMDQFGYANAVAYYHKGGCTIDEIKRAILPSLDLKSPCGVSVPGHAIVADGYGYNNDTLYVHFNMGWSGSDNVWYNPPDLTDSGYSDFNSISTIYYNVYPPSVCSEAGRSVVSGRGLSQSGNPVSGVTVTAQNKSSGASYSSVAATDSKGIYALLLPAGSYRVRAASGETAAVVDVDVQSGAKSATVNDKVAGSTVSYGSSNGIGGVNRNVYGQDLTLASSLPAPTFSRTGMNADTTFFDGTLDLVISTSVSGAQIRYTLDGSDPSDASALYNGPLVISASCTVKARTFKEGSDASAVASTHFHKLATGDNLVLNGDFEQHTVVQNSGAWSYCGGDGFSCEHWSFSDSTGLAAPNTPWIAADAFGGGAGGMSAFIQTGDANVTSRVEQTIAVPCAGKYSFAFTYAGRKESKYRGATTYFQIIKDNVVMELASVCPNTGSSALKEGCVELPSAGTYTLRFHQPGISGDRANIVDDVSFRLRPYEPVFAPKSGTVFFRNGQPITLSCVTDGAEIRYTLDGSEPTEQSALYEGPIAISASATIKARAFMAGMESSEVVAATYVRRAIIGENLVQNAAPVQGEVQTLCVAAPGTYAVSFDYAGKSGRYGERMELRLAKGGATNTLVSVAATSAGTFTTNFTFDVSSAGDWDLFVYNPASGATQPVTLSNLSIFIPETDESLGQYWIYETDRTFGSTGEWNAEPTFLDGKMGFEGRETFTPYEEQNGRRAVITLTMSFNYIADEELDFGEIPKTAVRIAEDKTSGRRTFSLLTSADGASVWRNVSAEGAGEPQLDVSYTFKFTMDCAAGTFTVALVNGDAETPLLDGANDTFAFANRRQTPVEEIEFQGSVYLDSLYGSYDDFVAAFAEGDVLALAGGALSDGLTAAQAAWLNSMNAYDAVKAKVGTIGADAFLDAWLLNLDLREEPLGSGALKVSGIEVTETEVKVSVKLERTGAMQNAAINGVLKLYGGTSLDVMAPLNETPVTNEDFASGDTALFVYPRSGEAKFFRPAIRQR